MKSNFISMGIFILFGCAILAPHEAGAMTYTFQTDGSWANSSNWAGGNMPPNPLNFGNQIVIAANCTYSNLSNFSYTVSNGASFSINAGKSLTLSATFNSSFEFYGNVSIGSGAMLSLTQTFLYIQPPCVFTNNGNINTDRVIANYSTINNYGSINLTGFAGFYGSASTVTHNYGSINVSGSNPAQGVGSLTNYTGATYTISSGSNFALGGGTVTNNGTFTCNGEFREYGTFNGTLTIPSGAKLQPTYACMTINGDLILQGTLDYFANSTNFDCFSGGGYGKLVVNGTATLTGSTFISGVNFTPANGTLLTILDATTVAGAFASETLPNADWDLQYDNPDLNEVSLYYNHTPVNYTFANAGDWTTPDNWIPSYPGTSILGVDVITIDADCNVNTYISSSAAFTVNPGASLTIASSLNMQGTLVNDGSIIVSSSGSLTLSFGSFLNNGQFAINSNGGLYLSSGATFTHNGTSASISGNLSLGFGFPAPTCTINAGKTLTINSDGGIYPSFSSTLNNNGTLIVNGSYYNYSGTFNNGGTLGGVGTLVGSFTNNGIVAPGNSPGCISFGADFTNLGGMSIELADGAACTDFDKIIVSGNADINGIITIIFPAGTPSTTAFTILTATGDLSGSPTITWPPGTSGTYFINTASSPKELQVSFTSLPIELVSFTRKQLAGTVLLDWRTASETNNEGFGVERSSDGITWERLAFVAGHGTTLEGQSYSFTDERPLPTVSYYRLRQVDYDGNFEYSPIVSVEMRHQGGLGVSPNPASSETTVSIGTNYSGEGNALLYDMTGRLLRSQALSFDGHPIHIELDLTGLPGSGLYLLVVQAGQERWQERIIVE